MLHPSLRSIDAASRARPSRSCATTASSCPGSASHRCRATRGSRSRTSGRASDGRRRGTPARASSSDLPLDLEGPVEPVDWWPDGVGAAPAPAGRRAPSAPPLRPRHRIASRALDTEPGSITAAAVRPDGEVWYRVHNGAHPAADPRRRLVDAARWRPRARSAPAGRVSRTWWFENPNGQRVHGFIVRPDGDGPYPVILRVHGGPHSLDMDRWAPGPPRPRRRRVPRRDGQLPRLRWVRAGVARRAHRQRRLPRARGRARGPRRPRRPRPRRPGARRPRGLVVGRLRDAAGPRPPPERCVSRDRAACRSPTTSRRVRGRGADPPGDGPRAVRRLARRACPTCTASATRSRTPTASTCRC